ncbi:CE1759 family FMN reductase [Tessaracoccus sp. G1721]
MSRIVVISGGLGTPSSTRVLADDILVHLRDDLAARGDTLEETVVALRELAHPIVDAMLTGFPTGDLARAVDAVEEADALVVVSPTFSASISGLVKSFFDILEPGMLTGKPVLLAATGGTERHSLMLEFAMRPLFSYLGADPVRTAIFAATSDFGVGSTGLRSRVSRGASELADAVAGRRSTSREPAGFLAFEQLLAG